VADHAKPRTVRDTQFDFALPPEWQSAHDLAASGAERAFIDQFARHAQHDAGQLIPAPVVGYEAEDGIPIDFAWPDSKIAVCLDLAVDDRRVLEMAGWRVFPDDPDAVFAALREAA